MEGAHFFFEPSSVIQQATSEVFHSEAQFKKVTEDLKKVWSFDSVNIHLVCQDQKFIETVHVDLPPLSSLLQQASKQARFSLNANSINNIFTHVIDQKTQIVMISGWSELFHQWVYRVNQHDQYLRLWLPILLIRDGHGKISYLKPSKPTAEGLGMQAIRAKKPKLCGGEDLEHSNPKVYQRGIRLMGTNSAISKHKQ